MKRLLSFVSGLVSVLLVLLILAAGAMAFSARLSADGIPTIRDHKVLSVISGSMEPSIKTGDAIVIRPVAGADQIAVGDVITFHTKEKKEMLVTHRVQGIVLVNGEPRAFVTKGDANEAEDLSTVAFEQVIGRFEIRLPYLGYVSSFMRTPLGILLGVVLPGLVIIGLEFRKIWVALAESEAAPKAREQARDEE